MIFVWNIRDLTDEIRVTASRDKYITRNWCASVRKSLLKGETIAFIPHEIALSFLEILVTDFAQIEVIAEGKGL